MSVNPWEGMPPNNQRRASVMTERDLFWMTDIDGSFGFYIHAATPFSAEASKLSLKGITIAKRTSENGSDFFLVLSSKEDWPIFASLCQDLISVAVQCRSEEAMIVAVEGRLLRWQRLLRSTAKPLSLEAQMGLFAELSFLHDHLVNMVGLPAAVFHWKGPESEKQDFVCDQSAIEVKSYPPSKGSNVVISSLEQLWSEKPRLYIAAYGLSTSTSGHSVADLAGQLLELLSTDIATRDLFEARLGQYGYVADLPESDLEKFISDAVKIYKVSQDFPRISPADVAPEITTVKYSIDLSRCSRFEIAIDSMEL